MPSVKKRPTHRIKRWFRYLILLGASLGHLSPNSIDCSLASINNNLVNRQWTYRDYVANTPKARGGELEFFNQDKLFKQNFNGVISTGRWELTYERTGDYRLILSYDRSSSSSLNLRVLCPFDSDSIKLSHLTGYGKYKKETVLEHKTTTDSI